MQLIRQALSLPPTRIVPLLAALSLAIAYTAEYGFGILPCHLCLKERIPYWIMVGLGVVVLLKPGLVRYVFWALVLAVLAELGLSFYHFGVEQFWWGAEGCTAVIPASNDAASLRDALLATPVVRCDEVNWRFLGYSMVFWNVLFSLALLIYLGIHAARKTIR